MKKMVFLFPVCVLIFLECRDSRELKAENPKAILGHYLFFEKRISFNHSKSCASCHSPEYAFTDGYRKSVSADGNNLLHNAPSILNIAQNHFFDWDNPEIHTLSQQIKRPLYNKHPTELGMDLDSSSLLSFFKKDSLYSSLFERAYRGENEMYSAKHVEECIIEYVKNLNSRNSKFDQHLDSKAVRLNKSEEEGMRLFFSTELKCSQCHAPPDFTKSNTSNMVDSAYANIGLYNIANENKYPAEDVGLNKITKKLRDDGKFKIPSLRNVMLTAPYMHDGSVRNLDELLNIYSAGGQSINKGPLSGDGRKHRNKHPHIKGFEISDNQKKNLICFLSSLTDTTYLSNPYFLNPFRNK